MMLSGNAKGKTKKVAGVYHVQNSMVACVFDFLAKILEWKFGRPPKVAMPGEHCPICGSETVWRLEAFPETSYWLEDCQECGVQRFAPLPSPEDIESFYNDYPVTRIPLEQLPFLVDRSKKIFRFFMKKGYFSKADIPDIPFLEIGFGNGASLMAAAQIGFPAFGIELDMKHVNSVKG